MLKRKYVRQRCQLRKSTDLVQEPRTFSAYEYIAVLRTFSKSYRGIITTTTLLYFTLRALKDSYTLQF
jgi:hypothetical protein